MQTPNSVCLQLYLPLTLPGPAEPASAANHEATQLLVFTAVAPEEIFARIVIDLTRVLEKLELLESVP